MKILVLNCGSSSLKYQVFDMSNESVLAKGLCERIGIEGSFIKHENEKGEKIKKEEKMESHKEAIGLVLEAITNSEYGVLKSLGELSSVAHRLVHGANHFSGSVVIDEAVLNAVKDCVPIAPLHNPPGILGIEAISSLIPKVKQTATFDTAFHQSMPEKAYLYALPYKYYEEHNIRRYGFHGTSHFYVSRRVCEILNKKVEDVKIISAHLGSGSSICAINGGLSVDTSMGFTPLEGLAMGTRSGDIDAGIIEFIAKKEGLDIASVLEILNKKSGVLGISEVSNDFRDLEDAIAKGDKKSRLALDLFHYRVAKYIGAYTAAMNGVDIIVFTAGVGENSPETREAVCSYLGYLGVEVDKETNSTRGREVLISKNSEKSSPLVYVIPTNEELVIARDSLELIK